jgi:hypothetical protein
MPHCSTMFFVFIDSFLFYFSYFDKIIVVLYDPPAKFTPHQVLTFWTTFLLLFFIFIICLYIYYFYFLLWIWAHLNDILHKFLQAVCVFMSIVAKQRLGKNVPVVMNKRRNVFCSPILFAICTSKLCKQRIQWHAEDCWVALLCK